MSEVLINLHMVFDDAVLCDQVDRGLQLAVNRDFVAAQEYFARLGEPKLIHEHWKYETYSRDRNLIMAEVEAGASSMYLPDVALCLNRLGARRILAEEYNAQVNEQQQYAWINGKRAAAKVVLKQLAEENPTVALIVAISKRKAKEALRLLAAGVNPNASSGGRSLLRLALYHDIDKQVVLALLKAGADANAPDRDGNRPLPSAITKYSYALIDAFIQAGADVNARMNDGSTALHAACEYWLLDIAVRLIDAGADVNAKNNNADTPLISLARASAPGHREDEARSGEDLSMLLDRLLAAGANIHHTRWDGSNALYAASAKPVIATWLKRHGVPLAVPHNYYTGTAPEMLKKSIQAGDGATFHKLLAEYRHVLSKENIQELFDSAIFHGPLDLVQALIEIGADPNVEFEGRMPLSWAMWGVQPDVLQCLIANGADTNLRSGSNEMTALMTACQKRNIQFVNTLLEAGADPNLTRDGQTALYVALGCPAIVKILLAHGARVDVRDESREQTPLMMAAEYRCIEEAEILLAASAAIDEQDNQGRTALMYAVYGGGTKIVKFLFERGADPAIMDKKGWTVDSLARSEKMKMLVKELSDRYRQQD